MNLSVRSAENIEYMVTEIKDRLRIVNAGAIKASHFNDEMYEELHDLYTMVMKRDNFSPSEMQAIAEELGSLRKG
ncbi:DUF1128 domain-containing protein [Jeotgalibacillus proteolyticus]|uniref:UPF0435 protein C4B60_18235 n=1 Tax=Jeotgalibacillus proteolyticus TaxID=2082395 RepID=A0A2S5G796_9BACL|nr:DUF1128 domain-containing protein [Jeotgalibacillus proteolyticus]PPA68857.1 DUF1128 domain-containing protein [Jeotgalibacillus proteolyticus]